MRASRSSGSISRTPRTDACVAQLRKHFSDAEIVELTFIVGYQTFASKFAKAFRLVPQGFAASV